MSQISYINGRYLPHSEAATHIEDRGNQFSDGVYEVAALINGRLLDAEPHLERLERSLNELSIKGAPGSKAIKLVVNELIKRNHRKSGLVYIQVSRGVAKRDHAFPKDAKPSVFITINKFKQPSEKEKSEGVKLITHPEIRWARRDIKSISLLPNILAKQKAVESGSREALFVDKDGVITECSASNFIIIDKDGTVICHPYDHNILCGITMKIAMEIAAKSGIKTEFRTFTLDETLAAKEAFMTGTSSRILPVTVIDDRTIANGRPGEITRKLMELYDHHVYQQTGH